MSASAAIFVVLAFGSTAWAGSSAARPRATITVATRTILPASGGVTNGHRRCFGRLGLPVERPVGGHVLHNELKASELHWDWQSRPDHHADADVARERVRRLANMGRLSDR